MNKTKKLRVSIVIPVYNEADHLDACLAAIGSQATPAFEVLVVDNNSSDASVAVAQAYKFVTILREPKQGVVHARNRGFNAARGDIIGRIDADTILDQDWVAQAQRIFAEPAVDAVSGSITYHDMPWPELTNTFDMFFRRRIVRGMADEGFLQGANMALRCSSWRTVKSATCNTKGLHEDFDLAIHLHDAAQTVVFDPNLHVGLSLRRFDTSYASFWGYALQNPKTYTAHGRTAQRHMYPMIAAVLIGYPLIRLLYRSYDPASQKFSIVKLFADSSVVRVNPATFVD